MIETVETLRLPPEEESGLLARAAADPAAFGLLYQAYVKPVYRYLYFRLGDRMDAEDLTEQVFTRALQSLTRYRHDGHFLAWLLAIARNAAADHYRRRKPVEDLEFIEAFCHEPAGTRPLEDDQRERLTALADLVRGLDEDERELLRLRFTAGLTFVEMAGLLKSGEAAVKKRFYRLLDRLKFAMEGAGHES